MLKAIVCHFLGSFSETEPDQEVQAEIVEQKIEIVFIWYFENLSFSNKNLVQFPCKLSFYHILNHKNCQNCQHYFMINEKWMPLLMTRTNKNKKRCSTVLYRTMHTLGFGSGPKQSPSPKYARLPINLEKHQASQFPNIKERKKTARHWTAPYGEWPAWTRDDAIFHWRKQSRTPERVQVRPRRSLPASPHFR